MYGWPNWITPYFKAALSADECYVEEMEPYQPPGPEIPAEVHNTRPVDSAACMEAVRAMCRAQ